MSGKKSVHLKGSLHAWHRNRITQNHVDNTTGSVVNGTEKRDQLNKIIFGTNKRNVLYAYAQILLKKER